MMGINAPSLVTLADIEAARTRLAPYLAPTPLEEAPALGKNIWLKLENANKTHAFKIRGALNAMLSLDDAARARGIQ
jgi:threonine dehydratase